MLISVYFVGQETFYFVYAHHKYTVLICFCQQKNLDNKIILLYTINGPK